MTAAAVAGIIVCAFAYAGAFDLRRYAEALPDHPETRRRRHAAGFQPLAGMGPTASGTLSMSIAGTVLGAAAALPLGALAARNIVEPNWIGGPVRLFLNCCVPSPA